MLFPFPFQKFPHSCKFSDPLPNLSVPDLVAISYHKIFPVVKICITCIFYAQTVSATVKLIQKKRHVFMHFTQSWRSYFSESVV